MYVRVRPYNFGRGLNLLTGYIRDTILIGLMRAGGCPLPRTDTRLLDQNKLFSPRVNYFSDPVNQHTGQIV